MKSTGMTRQVDKMGRVVIPKEIRAQLNIKNNVDSFEISVQGEGDFAKIPPHLHFL